MGRAAAWGGCFNGKQVKDCRWAWFQPGEYRKVAGWPPRRVRGTVMTQNVRKFLLVEQTGTATRIVMLKPDAR